MLFLYISFVCVWGGGGGGNQDQGRKIIFLYDISREFSDVFTLVFAQLDLFL